MTGPEHYRAAEALIQSIAGNPPTKRPQVPFAQLTLQLAQVHATLALAAASGDNEEAGLDLQSIYPPPWTKDGTS